MTEVGVNDYYIDAEVRARFVREAEQMRSEFLRESFSKGYARLAQLGAWTWRQARSLGRRSRWNLSVPAPHR